MPLTFVEAEERLAATLPGYEPRPTQRQLAQAIEAAMANRRHLLAQGPTGVGKSLAAAIPAIAVATTPIDEYGHTPRVIIATATKNLQDQLDNEDLPFLADNLGEDFTFAVLKGRSSYLCRSRLNEVVPSDVRELPQILEATANPAFDGQRERLGFDVHDRSWRQLTVSGEECPGRQDCPYGSVCYAERAKASAKAADITVVNHALLLVDLELRSIGATTMLGDYDHLVIDEAHAFEGYATNVLGVEIKEGTFTTLAAAINSLAARLGYDDAALGDASARMLSASTALWEVLVPGRLVPSTLLDNQDTWVEMVESLFHLLAQARYLPQVEGQRLRRQVLLSRIGRLSERLREVVTADFASIVRWVTVEQGWGRDRGERKVLHVAPIDVAPYLRKYLFSRTPTVLMSATLAVDGKLSYIAGRLGVDDYDEIVVGSPFDFTAQAALYVPDTLPAPAGGTRAAWASLSVAEIEALVRASRGRALVLFTSKAAMRDAYAALSNVLPYTCMMQGQRPNSVLLKDFKDDTSSVLFGTRSWFEGVNVPGEALSLLIVDKLPFPMYGDPLIASRCEAIERSGGNPFADYTIPETILVLLQALGRLIRSVEDYGVMAILDSRLTAKFYGSRILASLPPATQVYAVDDVARFFTDRDGAAV